MKRAVHIIPDLSSIPQIERFRRSYDRLHPHIAAHITLVFPFDHPVSDESLLSHCCQCASDFRCFQVQLLAPQRSADDYFWLPVRRSNALQELANRLHTGPLAVLNRARGLGDFHITLARPPLPPTIESAFRHDLPLSDLSVEVTSITIEAIQPDEGSVILGHFPLRN